MTVVLYPGSFDPVHNGHVDLIETAASLFDEVVVATLFNPAKVGGVFDLDEREQLLVESVGHLDAVRITRFGGLVVDAAREAGADFIVKGLRGVSDFEVELQMAQTNHVVSGIRTVWLPTSPHVSFVASTFIRQIAQMGGEVGAMVPPPVAQRLKERYAS